MTVDICMFNSIRIKRTSYTHVSLIFTLLLYRNIKIFVYALISMQNISILRSAYCQRLANVQQNVRSETFVNSIILPNVKFEVLQSLNKHRNDTKPHRVRSINCFNVPSAIKATRMLCLPFQCKIFANVLYFVELRKLCEIVYGRWHINSCTIWTKRS